MSKVLLKCNVTGLPNESESYTNSKGLAKAIGAEQAFVEEADPRVEASNASVSGWATDSLRALTVELTGYADHPKRALSLRIRRHGAGVSI